MTTIKAGKGWRIMGANEKPDYRKGDEAGYNCKGWISTIYVGDKTISKINEMSKGLCYRRRVTTPTKPRKSYGEIAYDAFVRGQLTHPTCTEATMCKLIAAAVIREYKRRNEK